MGFCMSSTNHRPVRRRRVLYIPGYDPFPPRRYRELYRREAAAQAAISGYAISLEPNPSTDGFGWRVVADTAGQRVVAEIDVLIWSDIVQQSRPRAIWTTYVDLLRTAWIYISTGAIFRLMRLRKGPLLAALYPVAVLLWQLGTSVFLGWCVFRLTSMALDGVLGPLGSAIGAGLGVLAAMRLLHWFKDNDGRFFAYYLMHDFAFSAAGKGAYADVLETRLAAFRRHLMEALSDDVDEVLVVGHSSGAHLGISLLADVFRAKPRQPAGPALSFLSLGHVVPMVSFLPLAHRLRGDLQLLSTLSEITWVDVSAPGDGCCFALCDPVTVSGQDSARKKGPLVFSAAFTQSLSPERWHALRWRFFRLHFQYLCAFDRPKDYDYFQITAGPKTLRARYEGRPASKSRRASPVSAYTSTLS